MYRARDSQLDRDVAIKVLPGSLASDLERLRCFEQEARAVGALYLVTKLLKGPLRLRMA